MKLKGLKILVTGASGLVGSRLIERLLEEGAQVRGTRHRNSPRVQDGEVEYVQADLLNEEDCRRAVEGIDLVFHCAANTSGAATMASTPMVHVTPNLIINARMLEAAYDAGIKKFIWLSSTTGYPESGEELIREDQMFDGDPYEKYFFVGWMKRATEVMCRMYGEKLKKTMTTLVLRPTNIYGEHDDFDFETSHVLPALIRKVVERWDPIEVWGDGNDVRDVIHVDDMVRSMMLAAEKLDGYHAINIGLGKGYSVKEMLETIMDLDGYTEGRLRFDADKPTMIPIRLIDTTLAETTLGFKAGIDLREGLKRTIDWYRENQAK